MRITSLLTLAALAISLASCGSGGSPEKKQETPVSPAPEPPKPEEPEGDPQGIGKFRDLTIPAALDAAKATAGIEVYDVKCASCHKLDEKKLVGPGWKGVTTRRRAEWILNFITNVDEMLDKDKLAKGMLAACMVRMPNQQLSDADAYGVYEYMRQNDGVK